MSILRPILSWKVFGFCSKGRIVSLLLTLWSDATGMLLGGGGGGGLVHAPPVFFALRWVPSTPPPPHPAFIRRVMSPPPSATPTLRVCQTVQSSAALWPTRDAIGCYGQAVHVRVQCGQFPTSKTESVQLAERTCSSSSGLPRVKLRPFWVTDFAPRCQSKVQRFVCLDVCKRVELGQRETSVQKMY